MENQQNITTLSALKSSAVPAYDISLTDSQGFELAQRAAKLLANSTLVPTEFRENIPNCVIALNMAKRIGADPLMVMQNLYIVYGKPSWSSKFMIATVNTCGRFSALRFEFVGTPSKDDYGCRAIATEKSTGDKLIGMLITIELAKAEGWYQKKGSKWITMPDKMLMYRAGAWWADLYAPELSMGLRTVEENYDIINIDKNGNVIDNNENYTTENLKRKTKIVEPEPEIKKGEELEMDELKISPENTNVTYTTDEMNQIMDLVSEIKSIRDKKDELIKMRLGNDKTKQLDQSIAKCFQGFSVKSIKEYKTFLENIK